MPIRLTQSVKVLLALCVGVFVIQQTGDRFFGTHFLEIFALNSSVFSTLKLWQLLTYPFVHSDVTHLFFNLMMLAFIGSDIEGLWGSRTFLKFFLYCSLAVGLVFAALQSFSTANEMHHGSRFMMGTSGVIYALLMAYGMLFGERVLLFMMLFPMKAKHFVWVLVGLEVMTTLYSSGGIWAGGAQLSGLLAGFLYVRYFRRGFPKFTFLSKRSKKRRSKHLRLVVGHADDKNNIDKRSGFRKIDDESPDHPRTWH